MIDITLMLYCFVAAGAFLLFFTLIHEWAGRKLDFAGKVAPELLEPAGPAVFLVNFIMEGLFFVAIPTMAYSFFWIVLPLESVRPAVALALAAFTLGAVPALMGLSMRLKLPMPYLLYYLFGLLLKLTGCIVIIGYLYSL